MNELPKMTQAQRIMYRDPVLVVLAAIEQVISPTLPPPRLQIQPAQKTV